MDGLVVCKLNIDIDGCQEMNKALTKSYLSALVQMLHVFPEFHFQTSRLFPCRLTFVRICGVCADLDLIKMVGMLQHLFIATS